jgi:tetraacyldisaccharide 4'-kinase
MLSSFLVSWGERLFFRPNFFDWVIIIFLTPLSLIYGSVMLIRRVLSFSKKYPIPIVSVGNLTVGGSGKTPFVIALASRYQDVTIISRGYKRESRGVVEVSRKGEVLTDVYQSGDEPMLMAKTLQYASVIVSEDRHLAIQLAIRQGAKLIILDDGFNRVDIKKFEILLFPKEIKNPMPFPAGSFREFFFLKYFADLNLKEGMDFKRVVTIENPQERMLLVTAISNPQRLEPYLPDGVVGKIYLEDHAYFEESVLLKEMKRLKATTLLVTEKDAVKMEGFSLELSIMKLILEIDQDKLKKIDHYVT